MFVQNWLVIILINWIQYNIIDIDGYQVGNWIKIKSEIRIIFDTLHNALKANVIKKVIQIRHLIR